MSYGLMVYRVDLEKVASVIGSNDEKLVRMIGGRFKADIASADEWFADSIEEGAPSLKEAVRQLVFAEEPNTRFAFQYSYAYELLCRHFGHFQPNDGFSPIKLYYLDTFDEYLAKYQIEGISTNRLAFGRSYIELPPCDDFPGTGYIGKEDVKKLVAAYGDFTPPEDADYDFQLGWNNIASWLKNAAEKEWDIVSFCY